jgi:hypothetical protein
VERRRSRTGAGAAMTCSCESIIFLPLERRFFNQPQHTRPIISAQTMEGPKTTKNRPFGAFLATSAESKTPCCRGVTSTLTLRVVVARDFFKKVTITLFIGAFRPNICPASASLHSPHL